MSLVKVPFVFLAGLGAHVTFTLSTPAIPKKQRMMKDASPVEVLSAVFIVKLTYWVHAAIELAIILAAAAPKSKVAENVLTFLLPGKDPSRIFLSPMSVLATVLLMIGGCIRLQCYREMGKHFTYHVTILKDHKLITSGPYSYVRHPGYTSACSTVAGLVIWYTARGSWLRESEAYKMPLASLAIAPLAVFLLLPLVIMFHRMPKEDKLLKETFGKEWDEWARKVPARIFPGIY